MSPIEIFKKYAFDSYALGDGLLADAILDRIRNSSLKGRSFREDYSKIKL